MEPPDIQQCELTKSISWRKLNFVYVYLVAMVGDPQPVHAWSTSMHASYTSSPRVSPICMLHAP